MTKNHNNFLNFAFHIAEKNLGKTKLNPSVGSVVVKNGEVISSAITSLNGRPHSEFNALNNLKNCSGATLYTTLEPCTHKGKTPPCVSIIIKKKIKKVYYAFEDPDFRTYKKAKKILNSNGIKAKLITNKKYGKFYNSYFLNKKFFIPFTSAKIAISKDYLSINKKNKWITNYRSRSVAHFLRNNHDCILSTSKSINLDDSLLNCRINGLNNYKPDLFIIDLKLRLKKKLSLINLIKKRNTYLITYKKNVKKIKVFKNMGYKIILINQLENKKDYMNLLKKIYKLGYSRMLVETGLTFLNFLLKNKFINNLYIFKSSTKLGNRGKNNSNIQILKNISKKQIKINLNGDKLYKKEF